MKQLVIMPGGFHPFHAGHLALYQSALEAFPSADVKVAATNDTSARPFPFKLKEKLAQLAGVPPGDFYQVKSPFRADEITKNYDPADTQLIFVRSKKDADKPPRPGGILKNGSPAYLQPISRNMEPMTQHAYMTYLPTVTFGPGMQSATEIRTAWPELDERRRMALVMSLYPHTQKNPKLAKTVVKMLDTAMGAEVKGQVSTDRYDDGLAPTGVTEVLDTKAGKSNHAHWNTSDPDMIKFNFTASNGVRYQLDFLAPYIGPENMSPYDYFDSDEVFDNSKFVSFEQLTNDIKGGHPVAKQGIEGTGSAAEVFGVVVHAIIQYVKKARPALLYFQAAEPNRRALYARMIQRVLPSLPGWASMTVGNGEFGIYNKRAVKSAMDANSQDVAEGSLDEGIHDPQIFKAVAMIGPMGAGKSTIAKQLVGGSGLRSLNLDNFNELLIKQGKVAGGNLTPDQLDRSWHLTQKQKGNWISERLGLLIDGSGRNIAGLVKPLSELEELGYDVMVILVNVGLDTSIQRQQQRAAKQAAEFGQGRNVPLDLAKSSYEQIQQNIPALKQLYGNRFMIINNEGAVDLSREQKIVSNFLNAPPSKLSAMEWIQAHGQPHKDHLRKKLAHQHRQDASAQRASTYQGQQQGMAEATGDERFDNIMSRIRREPRIPDSQMPPTDVKDLYHWAVKHHKPYHKIFAEWAMREGYKSVAPALQKAGNLDSDALDYWTPDVWKLWYGPDSEMPRHWSKQRVPDELRDYLEGVFDAYDNIVFDWPTEYRQIDEQGMADTDGPGISFDSAEGFKNSIRQKLGSSDPELNANIDQLVVADPDGTVDVDQTLFNMVKEFDQLMPQILQFVKDITAKFIETSQSIEFQQASPAEQQSLLQSIKDMQAMLPGLEKQVADARAKFQQNAPIMQQNIQTKAAAAKPAQPVVKEVTRQMSQGGLRASYQAKYNQPMMEDYLDEARS